MPLEKATRDKISEDLKFIRETSQRLLLNMVPSDNRLSDDAKALFMCALGLILTTDENEWCEKERLYQGIAKNKLKDNDRIDLALKNLLEMKILDVCLLNGESFYSLGNAFDAYRTVFADLSKKPKLVNESLLPSAYGASLGNHHE